MVVVIPDEKLLKRRAVRLKSYYKNRDKYLEYNKKYRTENKDKRLEYEKTPKRKEYIKRYNETNKDRILARTKQWAIKNRSRRSASSREYNIRVRKAITGLLGDKCVMCGFNDPRALQIDHVNGGGCKEIRNMTKSYYKSVLEKLLSGSKDYQLLCANCNWIKRFENKEVRGKY
jgi:hypothetical protein